MIKGSACRQASLPTAASPVPRQHLQPRAASLARTGAKAPASVQPEAIRVWLNASALWEALGRLDISQNELARRSGITGAYLSQLVNRKRSPSLQTVQRLLTVLGGIPFHDIFVVEYPDED